VKDQRPTLLIPLSLVFIFLWTGLPALSADLSSEERFEQGLSFYKKGEFARALKIFQQSEEELGEHRLQPDAIFMQGQALRALNNWPEAARAFSRAAETHALLSDYALFFQGEALQKMGEGEKGIEIFQSLVALHPQSRLVPQAHLRMAEIYLGLGNYSKTMEIGERLLKGNAGKDSSAQIFLLLGQAREGLKQFPEAIKTYQELWVKYPLHSNASKARLRWESLVREKKIPAEKIPPEALLQRALQFYQANFFEAALSEIDEMEGYPLRSYPTHYSGDRWIDDLYFHRGMCHFRLKQYSKAVETFDLIVRNSRNEGAAEKSLFWMFQTFVRSGRNDEALSALALLQASYPQSSFMAQALYLQAAVNEEMGETVKAISLYRAMAEKYPQNSLRFGALWSAGWLLYLSKDYPAAIQDWDRLKNMEPNFRWIEKVLYWKGRALEKMGQTREAEESYGQLLSNFSTSYYSQLVLARRRPLGLPKGPFPPLEDRALPPFMAVKENLTGSMILHLEKGRVLARLTLLSLAVEEFEAAEEEGTNLEDLWMEISRLYREAEDYYRSNLLVRKKFALKPLTGGPSEREKTLHLLAYPPGHPSLINRYASARNLDPALLCAVILEESRFHSQALSPAGARGLMQIIPPTGKKVAKELKVPRFSADQLFEPGVNIRLGSWYLAKLLEDFGGKIPLALAAYNAGPHMVRKWLTDGSSTAEDEFVENIPYSETRNYVIRVMTSAQVYRTLYRPPEKPAHP
jgi:soluble lytic murein transglycosylase